MKFLCDQCKAKYQISDDKVAGKTVRMKCRKCGHIIELRAAVTETSVAEELPLERTVATNDSSHAASPRTSLSDAPQGSALAHAFAMNLGATTDAESGDPAAADEWYCAIGGVPVGPIGLSELRQKIAAGSATEDSLVWRDGLEEWRPMKQVGELAALLREASQAQRAPGVAPTAPRGPATRPPAPSRASIRAPAAREPGPRISASPAALVRSNVIPLRPSAAPATGGASVAASLTSSRQTPAAGSAAVASSGGAFSAGANALAADPFAAPASDPFQSLTKGSPGSAATSADAPRSLLTAPDPFAAPAPAFATASALTSPASAGMAVAAPIVPLSPVSLAPAAKPVPWIPIAMVFGAVAFGVTAAIVLLVNKPQPAQVTVVQVPQNPTPGVATAAVVGSAASTALDTVASAAVTSSARVGGSGPLAIAGTASAKAAAPSTSSAVDMKGLLGNNTGGPSSDPSPGGPSGGPSLTSDDVQRTVSNFAPSVKRRCWDGATAGGSVNVTVAVNVAANGTVQSASASGNDPAVAKCIENAVRSWKFPASGGSSSFNIPFKFVRQ